MMLGKCPLSQLTAFCFENKLGLIKKYVRHGKKPLAQVSKRIEEEFELNNEIAEISEIKVMKCKKFKDRVTIQRLQVYDSVITSKNPDNVVILKNKTIVQVDKMDSLYLNPSEEDINIHGNILKIMKPALEYPSSSADLDMFQMEIPDMKENLEKITFKICDIKSKMVLLKIFELESDLQEWYAILLLHKI